MTPFEHLSVLISIILGLGLAHLLTGVYRLVQEITRVKVYSLSIIWVVLVFMAQVEWWWASFEFRSQFDWNFFYFLFVLVSPVSLFLAAGFVLPEIEPGTKYDLKDYYFHSGRWLFPILAIAPLFDAIRRGTEGAPLTGLSIWSNLTASALLISMTFVKKEWYHWIITILICVLFLYFIITNALQI